MKITFILLLGSLVAVSAPIYSQNTKLNLSAKNSTLIDIFRQIEDQSEFYFYFNKDEVKTKDAVSIEAQGLLLNDILDKVLEHTGLEYKIIDRYVVVKTIGSADPTPAVQSGQKVTGKVTDTSGAPLPGVSVIVKGTSTGIVTDVNGAYALNNIPSNAVLQFLFVGMTSQEIAIKGKSVIDVVMAENTIGLEEIVAVGYGIQKKKLVTGATVQVKGDDLAKMNTASAMTALQSQTSGVNITKVSGEPGAGLKVNIRGIGTIGNSQPLYVVDGAPRGDINNLSPADIESIDILKDAASSAIYGSRAANGVILVTTKQGKAGKMSVSYDGYYGIQNLYKRLPLLDAKEYLMIMNEANMNSNLGPISAAQWNKYLAPGDYDRIMNGSWTGTNWLKQMENPNAPVQSHALNINGGNERSKYSMGLSYTSQEGIFGSPVQSKYDRFTFRMNSDHVILHKNFDVIKVGENITMTYVQNHGIATGNMWWNDVSNAIKALPILPMYATDKSDLAYPFHYAIPWNTNYSNPNAAMQLTRGDNISKNQNLNANAYLEIQPIKGLKFRSSFTISPSSSA